jgi:branched-chain amino acid aminotransferase
MIEAKWNVETGWDPAFIVPHTNTSLYPSAKVLLRGQQVYDEIQVLMGFDNRIRMFRPNLHMERLRRSAARMGLPDFDANEMTICLKRLILTDASFLPPSYSNGSLEIKLVMMGIDDDMRFKPAEDVVLYAYANRHTAATVAEITKPQVLFADSQYSRTSVGGIGEYMTSANDAPALLVTQIAHQQGYNNVLWLHSKEELITSLNDASVFVFMINELGKRELITPPLNGLIIPGVVRQTILEMTRHWVSSHSHPFFPCLICDRFHLTIPTLPILSILPILFMLHANNACNRSSN